MGYQGVGIATYMVEAATANGGSGVLSTTDVGDVVTAEITAGADGDTLYYRVAGVDNAGNQADWSPSSTGLPIDGLPPATPLAPTHAEVYTTTGSVTVDWIAVTDVGVSGLASYVLEVATANDGTGVVSTTDLAMARITNISCWRSPCRVSIASASACMTKPRCINFLTTSSEN